jgi:hypothetical protein
MCNIKPNERLEILDILNHPWFKNEILNDEDIKKIRNKEKIKKMKSIKNDFIEKGEKGYIHNSNNKDQGNNFGINLNKNLDTKKLKRKEKDSYNLRSVSQSIKYNENKTRKNFGNIGTININTIKQQRNNTVNKDNKDMPTKINSKYNHESLFGVNMHLIKMNNGKISNHMLPIGMAKDQKRKTEIIKNLLNQCFDSNVEGNKNRIRSSVINNKDKNSLNNFQVKFFFIV